MAATTAIPRGSRANHENSFRSFDGPLARIGRMVNGGWLSSPQLVTGSSVPATDRAAPTIASSPATAVSTRPPGSVVDVGCGDQATGGRGSGGGVGVMKRPTRPAGWDAP